MILETVHSDDKMNLRNLQYFEYYVDQKIRVH